MIFTPGRFLGVSGEIDSRDVMMMPQLPAAHPGEVRLGAVGAGAVDAVSVLVIDPFHREFGVQRIPGWALVGMNEGSLGDPGADEGNGSILGGEHLGQRAAVAFAHHDHDLALP
jgi:hypothetical protein